MALCAQHFAHMTTAGPYHDAAVAHMMTAGPYHDAAVAPRCLLFQSEFVSDSELDADIACFESYCEEVAAPIR